MPGKVATDRWHEVHAKHGTNTEINQGVDRLATDRCFSVIRRRSGGFLRATDRWHANCAMRQLCPIGDRAIRHWRRSGKSVFVVRTVPVSCRIRRKSAPFLIRIGTKDDEKRWQTPRKRHRTNTSACYPSSGNGSNRPPRGVFSPPTSSSSNSRSRALDRREWPRTEAETRVARASLFTAQAIARDLIAEGRENEVEEIRDFISTIVPDVGGEQPVPGHSGEQTDGAKDDDQHA